MIKVFGRSGGYTIVEIMIFLAVSGLLLGSALLLINGQQAKAEFSQAVGDINSQIQDIINDVATGYYAGADTKCTFGAAPTTGGVKGTNQDCIFIGRVMSFGYTGDNTRIDIYDVVGNRLIAAPTDSPAATTMAQAKPRALLPPNTTKLPGGLTVGKVNYHDNLGIDNNSGTVGFYSTLAQYNNGKFAGDQYTQLFAYTGIDWTSQDVGSVSSAIATNTPLMTPNTTGYVEVCLVSAGTDQHAIITIGGQERLTTKVEIKPLRTCP